MKKTYFVYILGSESGTLYVGMTSNLERRIHQHKHDLIPGFTSNYSINRLLYFESTEDVKIAIEREKQIKSWRREKKVELIESSNPKWDDLSDGWLEESTNEPEGFGNDVV